MTGDTDLEKTSVGISKPGIFAVATLATGHSAVPVLAIFEHAILFAVQGTGGSTFRHFRVATRPIL